jgi:hypothetical protein
MYSMYSNVHEKNFILIRGVQFYRNMNLDFFGIDSHGRPSSNSQVL